MRLIDADGSFTVKACDNTDYSLAFGGGIISCANEFGHIVAEFFADDIPTIDAVPVVHARWDEVDWVEMESGGHELIRTPNAGLRCSNCRNCFEKKLLWKNNYCPNCGAKMDGGAGNG